jgi:hypothetical protein
MSFKISFKNLDKKIRGLRGVPDEIDREFAKAIFTELEVEVAGRAKAELAPVSPGGGALRGSIHVTEPQFSVRGFIRVAVVAGGPAAPYALAVHEWVDPKVNWTVPGTGPKFLEEPLNEARPGIERELEAALGRAVKKGLR